MPGLAIPVSVALLLGVVCSGAAPRGHAAAGMLVVAAVCCVVVAAAAGNRLALAAAATLLGFAGGWWLGLRAHDRAAQVPLRLLIEDPRWPGVAGDPTWIEGGLLEDASRSPVGVSLTVAVTRVRLADGWSPISGSARIGLYGDIADSLVSSWRRGRCIRAPAMLRVASSFRNPGVTDAALDLARRGISLVGSVKSAALVEDCGAASPLHEAAGEARDRFRTAVHRHVAPYAPLSAAVAIAILIGERAAIGDEVEERLRRAGTYHVIAISGGNIAILTGLLLWIAGWTRAPPRTSAAGAVAVLLAYAAIVVRGPSVDRAVLVALVYLVARAADVRAQPLALLATTACTLLLWEPMTAFDVGFALTFGATAGLILVTPPLLAWWTRVVQARVGTGVVSSAAVLAFAPLAATMAAEAAVLPIAATFFGRVTFAGLALNFLAVPLMAVVQVAGLATVALAELGLAPAADLAGLVTHLAVRGLVDSARLADAWPWLQRVTPPPGLALLLVHVAAVSATGVASLSARTRGACAAGSVLSCCAIAFGWWPAAPTPFPGPPAVDRLEEDRLRVTVLDVGQGDAVIAQFPGGKAMLVDAGGLAASPRFDITRRVISPALHALGVRRLHWLVVTHGDPDHVGGAAAILEDWRPVEVWEGVPVPRHAPLAQLRATAARVGASWRRVLAGDRIALGGVEVWAWHPPPADWERQRVRNDDSLVLDLRYGDVSIVLPGDIGALVEQRLVAGASPPRRLRVLKAAHHGSAGSSSREWLQALSPAAVIYSAGQANSFGHPSASAMAHATEVGADLFRTDTEGAVRVTTDGERLVIETMGGRRWVKRAR